jgi:hypothetical protein
MTPQRTTNAILLRGGAGASACAGRSKSSGVRTNRAFCGAIHHRGNCWRRPGNATAGGEETRRMRRTSRSLLPPGMCQRFNGHHWHQACDDQRRSARRGAPPGDELAAHGTEGQATVDESPGGCSAEVVHGDHASENGKGRQDDQGEHGPLPGQEAQPAESDEVVPAGFDLRDQTNLMAGAVFCDGTWALRSNTTAMASTIAWSPKAAPGPRTATTSPARGGVAILTDEVAPPTMAFAGASCSQAITSRRSAELAGPKTPPRNRVKLTRRWRPWRTGARMTPFRRSASRPGRPPRACATPARRSGPAHGRSGRRRDLRPR